LKRLNHTCLKTSRPGHLHQDLQGRRREGCRGSQREKGREKGQGLQERKA